MDKQLTFWLFTAELSDISSTHRPMASRGDTLKPQSCDGLVVTAFGKMLQHENENSSTPPVLPAAFLSDTAKTYT